MKQITSFAICAVSFLALDAVWLSITGPLLYRPAIGHLMRPDFDWIAAALFYVVYITGLIAFVVSPAATARDAARRGAAFGFIAYGTYDLTNQATMVGWPWFITAADLGWGTFATATACAIAHYVTSRSSLR